MRTAPTLQGSIADVAVDDVLRLLASRARSGVLVVNPANPLRLVLADGAVVHGGTSSTLALGRLLLAGGIVSAEQLDELFGLVQSRLGEQHRRDLDDSQVLVSLADTVAPGELAGAVRTQAVATLFEMLVLPDAEWRFDEQPAHPLADRFAVPIDAIVEEATAQVREWPGLHERVGGDATIFRRVRRLSLAQTPLLLDAVDWAALSEIDDRSSLGQIGHRLGLGRYEAAVVLAGLLDRGVVERA